MLNKIASHFDVAKPVNKVATLGEGFINDTFIVETVNGPRYILQRKNKNIFTDIPKMMENIPVIPKGFNATQMQNLKVRQPTTSYRLIIIRYK